MFYVSESCHTLNKLWYSQWISCASKILHRNKPSSSVWYTPQFFQQMDAFNDYPSVKDPPVPWTIIKAIHLLKIYGVYQMLELGLFKFVSGKWPDHSLPDVKCNKYQKSV